MTLIGWIKRVFRSGAPESKPDADIEDARRRVRYLEIRALIMEKKRGVNH